MHNKLIIMTSKNTFDASQATCLLLMVLAMACPVAWSFGNRFVLTSSRVSSPRTVPVSASDVILWIATRDEHDDVSKSNVSSSLGSNTNILIYPCRRSAIQLATLLVSTSALPRGVYAAGNTKSRSEGYEIQKTDEEWKSQLTSRQYDILRNGGTERQYSSVLEAEEREGTYNCAGCGTPLFVSTAKFHSGTGWPSFASALPGVEVEKVNILQAKMGGAELRCKTCGGHLGDVFQDGFIFVGTPAAQTGKRFCIDGAALIFKSLEDGSEVVGDKIPERVDYFFT